jgi:hypothetical protein
VRRLARAARSAAIAALAAGRLSEQKPQSVHVQSAIKGGACYCMCMCASNSIVQYIEQHKQCKYCVQCLIRVRRMLLCKVAVSSE